MLVSYIRDEKRNPTGCVVAVGKGQIGVSLCRKGDSFCKKLGREIAEGRARSGHHIPLLTSGKLQKTVLAAVTDMSVRVDKYYK